MKLPTPSLPDDPISDVVSEFGGVVCRVAAARGRGNTSPLLFKRMADEKWIIAIRNTVTIQLKKQDAFKEIEFKTTLPIEISHLNYHSGI